MAYSYMDEAFKAALFPTPPPKLLRLECKSLLLQQRHKWKCGHSVCIKPSPCANMNFSFFCHKPKGIWFLV